MNKVVVALLLAFFPGRADAASCPQPAGVPCTPDAAVKQGLVDKISEVTRMRSDMVGARSEWEIARKGENKEAELVAYEKFAQKAEELQSAADQLLESIGEAYSVVPLQKSGYARRPTTPAKDMRWMDGLKAEWKPKVSYSDFDYRAYKAKDGLHYAAVNTVSASGHTLPDGEVVISYQLLIDAFMDKNPGVIAQVLFHEGKHFSNLISTGWSYREDEEAAAYLTDIPVQDTFELSQSWRNVQNETLAANQGVEAKRKTTAYSSSRKEQNQIKGVIDAQAVGQVNLARYYQDLKNEVERLRREQEEEQRRAVEEVLRRSREARPVPLNPERPDDPAYGPVPLAPERPMRGVKPIEGPPGSDQIDLLRVISLKTCSDGNSITDSLLSEIDWARVREIPDRERGLANLPACESRVYSRLSDFARGWMPGMRITAAEVRLAASGGSLPGGGLPHGGGRDCWRDGDPFGCQPRHP